MKKSTGYALVYASLILYILGGIGVFCGVALIVLMKGKTLSNLGEIGSLGYLFLCVGLCFSMLGVILMRIVRNRLPSR